MVSIMSSLPPYNCRTPKRNRMQVTVIWNEALRAPPFGGSKGGVRTSLMAASRNVLVRSIKPPWTRMSSCSSHDQWKRVAVPSLATMPCAKSGSSQARRCSL